MQKIKEKFASITNNQEFDLAAYELKEMMNNQAVIHTDGYSLNYFCDSDKLVLKSHKNDDVFTHSFKTEKSGGFVNRYFQNKKIEISNYSNIILNDRHNFIIPIFNKELAVVGEERIYWDVSASEFKKIKNGEFAGNFYYYTKQTDLSHCEIIIIAESVANVLSFAELYNNKLDNIVYISTLGATNYLNALKSILEITPITKTVISLVDNDEAGINAYQQVKQYLSDKHIINYHIISDIENADFSDMYFKDKKALKAKIDSFFNNAGIVINQALQLELFEMADNKKELLNNFNILIYREVKKNLELFKFVVSNNQLYIVNCKTMTYELLDLHIINNFVINCIELINLHNLSFQKVVDNLLAKLKAIAPKINFDLSMNFKNGSIDLINKQVNNYFIASVNYVDFNYYSDEQYNQLFNDSNNPVKKFLTSTLPDSEDYTMLCDCLGFLLTKNNQEYLVSLYGSGANGKSLLMELIKKALDNVAVDISLDEALHNENTRIRLQNKLVALSSEFSGQLNNRDLQNFKTLVSGQPISARSLYENQITIENYAKFLTSTNEIISASTLNNDALLRRLAVIQFAQKFTPRQEIKDTLFKHENLELFFNFLIRCALSYQYKIRFSTNSTKLLQKINTATNNVLGFCQDYELQSGNIKVKAKRLFELYNDYCQENNFKPLGNNKFAEKIEQQGISKGRNSAGVYYLVDKELPSINTTNWGWQDKQYKNTDLPF